MNTLSDRVVSRKDCNLYKSRKLYDRKYDSRDTVLERYRLVLPTVSTPDIQKMKLGKAH